MKKRNNSVITREILANWEVVMRAQSLSHKTMSERIRVATRLCDSFETTPLLITTQEIVEWIARLATATTRWAYFTHLKALFRWLEITHQRMENPLLRFPSPRRPRYEPRPIPLSVIQDVLSQPLYKKTRVKILLAFNCGLRVSEIARMRGQDFDPINRQLQVLGKGGKVSVLPVHEELIEIFSSMPERGFWFPSPKGGHISPTAVGQSITNTFKRYGYRITAHQLRHSFATALLEADVDIRVTQELMRHESIQTTALYTRVLRKKQDQATNLLPVFTQPDSNADVASNASNAGRKE
ncbi:MAG: tyrosine-type recombinase/integrase [Arcanobacterium sp.]